MTILIALGSNQRHVRRGSPELVLDAAVAALAEREVRTLRRSRTWRTWPVGPSSRRYANAVIDVSTELPPPALLSVLHEVEAAAGRRRRGRRWTGRVLDLDLIAYGWKTCPQPLLWRRNELQAKYGARQAPASLLLPHPLMHRRLFVLGPALEIAPDWRHPFFGLTVRQMFARLTARR